MKIKIDENLPEELVAIFEALGHDVHTVKQESLAGRDDGVIFRAANEEERLLLTQDLDFSDVRTYQPGTHAGIVLVRLNSPSRRMIIDRMRQILALGEIESWKGCFVVVSDRKLRVRRS